MNGAAMATPAAQAGEVMSNGSGADDVIDMNDPQIRALLGDDPVEPEGSTATDTPPATAKPAANADETGAQAEDAEGKTDTKGDKPDGKAKPDVPADWQESVNKRIGEATAEAKAAKAEAERQKAAADTAQSEVQRLKTEVETLRAETQAKAQGKHAAEFAESEAAFNQIVARSAELLEQAQQAYEEGGYTQADGTVLTKNQLKQIISREQRFLSVDQIPLRAALQARLANADRVAAANPSHKEAVQAVLTEIPQLRTLPNGGELALQIALGRRLQAAGNKGKTGAPPRPAGAPPAPVGGSSGAGAPSLAGSRSKAPTQSDLEREYYAALERR